MYRKQVGLVAAGLVGGLVIASVVHWGSNAEGSLTGGMSREAMSQLAERDLQIAALRNELQTLRSTEGVPSSAMAGLVPLAAEQDLQLMRDNLRSMREMDSRNRPDRQRRESERLMAAGFSRDRIAWIQQRREELQAQQEQFWKEQKDKGRPIDVNMASAYMFDPDLDLRTEIGDDEYAKYRQALGRPVGIGILQVQPNTSAAGAGIKLGDQIVAYGGRRVYNVYMLNSLVAESSSSGVVTVDVLRDGQVIQLVLPRGPLSGLVSETPPQAMVRATKEEIQAQLSGRVGP
jgi:hypothetical protein